MEHSKSFYFASLFVDAERRRAIWAVYAFCRMVDDIADSNDPAAERLAAIDAWQSRLYAAYAGSPNHAIMLAFAHAAARFDIPIAPALALLRGVRSDVTVHRYESFADLRDYCYLVASTVGLLTCPVLGCAPEAIDYGVELGRAMQMTNILRDVGEDYRAGRVYLPQEDLRRFGYPEGRLALEAVDDAFVALMRFQIDRVRAMYREAEPGIALLSRESRFAVRLALSLYRGILDEIERNGYDVFTRRAHVPMHAKISTALGTFLVGV